MKLIVLASTSSRRKTLLKQLGLEFIVISSKVSEKLNPRLKPKGQAEALSLQKAMAVADIYRHTKNGGSPLIIGADTIVSIDDEILGKPKSAREAKRMLKKLSGKIHCVITGFTIIDMGSRKIVTKSIETVVHFKKLNVLEISEYIKKEKFLDIAGSYAIQGLGAVFVEKIDGDYFNVVGLPLHALTVELRKFGVEVL